MCAATSKHEERLGINIVDIAKLVKKARRLFYRDELTGKLWRWSESPTG